MLSTRFDSQFSTVKSKFLLSGLKSGSMQTSFSFSLKAPKPVRKAIKPPAVSSKLKQQTVLHTHSDDSTLNLDVITPFAPHTAQQKVIVTSTPADGMVGSQPLTQIASAPTPILPQGIATAVKVHGGDAAARSIKKAASWDKTKAQKGVHKSQLSSKPSMENKKE